MQVRQLSSERICKKTLWGFAVPSVLLLDILLDRPYLNEKLEIEE
jgi:hypothetical protein